MKMEKPEFSYCTERAWATVDRTRLVSEGDPEAATLVGVPRQRIVTERLSGFENADEFFSVNPPAPLNVVANAVVNSTSSVSPVNPELAPETPLVTITHVDGSTTPATSAASEVKVSKAAAKKAAAKANK